ncbi:MAG: hypothetical protein ACI9V1_002196 [Spirosomataceae bacterium]|jgi:hypothetical protein
MDQYVKNQHYVPQFLLRNFQVKEKVLSGHMTKRKYSISTVESRGD